MSAIKIVREGSGLVLDPAQSGFAHGYGLFETMRLAAGRLIYWEAHWARLEASARRLRLPLEPSREAVLEAIRDWVLAEGLSEASLKMSLLKNGQGADLYLYRRPLSPLPRELSLKLETACPLNEHSPLAGLKTHNYLEHIWLLEQARAEGYGDCLRINRAGDLAETCVANLFFFKEGRWHTPGLACGVLPGVMRSALIRLETVETGSYRPETLKGADAVAISNASWGLVPVARIGTSSEEWRFPAEAPALAELQGRLAADRLEHSLSLGK